MSTCKRLLVTLLALAALPQGAAAGLRQLAGKKEPFCMQLMLVKNKEWTITGFNKRKRCSGKTIDAVDGELKIPKEHDGMPITKIGDHPFMPESCTSLKSVKMHSVTEIGRNAFHGCTRLASVEMPSIKEIGDHAFDHCHKLASVSKMPSVTKIGDYAFWQCHLLASVKMPSVTKIGKGAFRSCTHLASVEMPSVTEIGNGAFDSCTYLASVEMPYFTKIGKWAFAGCTSLCDQPMFKDTC